MAGELKRLQVHVVMADGTEHDVTIGNPDMVRFDMERERRKWAGADSAPILWMTFCTWAAMTRGKLLDGMPFDAFTQEAEAIDRIGDDDVTPTGPGHAPG